jgi:SAM-dependent methyltransferase
MSENEDLPTGDKSVSPDTYDSRYFFTSCEGYKEFRVSGGRTLGPRFQKALQLARIRPGQRVLDVGCGRGELVIHAALRGAEAVGIDYAEEAVRIAEEALAGCPLDIHERASFRVMNARRLDFPDESFDTAVMSDIVEHLYPQELREALDETRRVLRRGGRLVVHTCPNRLFYDLTYPVYVRNVHRVILRLAEIARYQSYTVGPMLSVGPRFPRTADEREVHVNEQTAAELKRALIESGFRVEKTVYWEIPGQWPYVSRRLTIELMILDALRYLRPLSYAWPLNRLFTNHIWMVATRV